MAPLYLAGSMLGAGVRGWRGDYRDRRGRIALALKVITWGLLALIMRRNVKSQPYFEAPLEETLGDDYEAVAAQSRPLRRRNLIGVPPHELIRRRYVEKADTVRYGPHPRVNFADIWRRRDLPRDGKAPVLLQVPGGAWSIGMRRPQAYPLLSHLAERGWICVSIDYRVSPGTPGRTTSSTSNVRWRGSRSTSPSTAGTPTSWRSPVVRRAAICVRWPR